MIKKTNTKLNIDDIAMIFQSLPESYLILDKDFNILTMSDAYSANTNIDREATVGRYIFDVFPNNPVDKGSSHLNSVLDSLRYAVKTRSAHTMAIQKYDIKKAGSTEFEERYWSATNIPIFDASGVLRFIIHKVTDVTDVMIVRHDDTNVDDVQREIILNAREVQLSNNLLIKANQNAERLALEAEIANHKKSEFLANMSHEIRTPLNSIVGFSELLHNGRVGDLTSTQREYVGDILSSSKHLLQLINDILSMTTLEASQNKLNYTIIDMDALISEVVDIFKEKIDEKELKCKIIIDENIRKFRSDYEKVKQILYQYVSNAIKFSHSGGTIEVLVEKIDNDFVKISVIDNGIGVDNDHIDDLFLPFHQLDSGTNKAYQGTGLGLAIVKKSVDMLGGQVGVKCKIGNGCKFYAIFPDNKDK